jgi:general secretion pathway protein A
VEHEQGLLLLLGDVGTGKSILSNALEESLAGEGIRLGKVPYPGLELLDFHAVVAEAFGLPSELSTAEDFVEQFARFLAGARARTERVLLLIDEAQHLRPELFAGIERLLQADAHAALERDGVLSILLVGDNSLAALLREGEQLGLASHITVRCELGPLSPDEVAAYIRHRLTMAGIDTDRFTTDASREVGVLSEGIPRLIDGVCGRALATARIRDVPVVDAVLVKECAETADAPADVDVSIPPPNWVDGVAARRWSIGARHLRSAAVAIIVGLVGIGIGLTAGYWYRSQGDARHRPVPVPTATSGSEADIAPPLALSPTTGPPSVARRDAVRPPNLDAEPVRPVPRVEQRRTPASPSGASAAVRGVEQRARLGMPSASPRTTTGEPSGALAPTDSAVPIAPSAPVPRGEPPRSASARGEEEPDSGAVIDWLLRRRHTD